MPLSTITNVTKDIFGVVVPNTAFTITLVPPGGFRISDSSEVTPVVTGTSDSGGVWSASLERTSNISPSGSFYVVQEQYTDAQGGNREYAFTVGDTGPYTLYASLLVPPPSTNIINYLTQAQGDARYALLGSATSGFFLVSDYGAVGDGITDDTVAINAALSAANAAGGGIVKFQGKSYLCNSFWDYSSFANVHCLGVASKGGANGTRIIFAGTYNSRSFTATTSAGTTSLTSADAAFTSADKGSSVRIPNAGFNASQEFNSVITSVTNSTTVVLGNQVPRTVTTQAGAVMGAAHVRYSTGLSANGCTWKHMRFEVSSTSFFGDIFNCWVASGGVPGYLIWQDCLLGIAAGASASTFNYNNCINWDRALLCTTERVHFNGGMTHSIRGVGNTTTVDDCRFEAIRAGFAHILNCNQAFRVMNCNVFASNTTSSALFDVDISQPNATATFIANQVADGQVGGGGDGLSGIRFHGDHINVIGGLYEDADYAITLIGSANLTATLSGVNLGGSGYSIRYLTTPIGSAQKVQAVVADNVTLATTNPSPFLNEANCLSYYARGNQHGTDSTLLPLSTNAGSDSFGQNYQPADGQIVILDTTGSQLKWRSNGIWYSVTGSS